MTYYDLHPPTTEAIRARVERGDYSSVALFALRTLLNRLDDANAKLRFATEKWLEDS